MARERKGSRELCDEAEPFQNRLGQAFAALASKRKCLQHDRADFLFDIVAQHGAGAVQSGFHGLRFQFENFCSLLDVHSLDHAGDENDAKGLGEFVDGVLDDMLNLTLCHGFFRVLGCGREGKLDNLRLERSRRQRGPFDVRTLAAQPAQSLVDCDPSKPGCETGVAAEILQMGECPDIGFLHHVLGFAVVAQDSAGEPIEPAIVRLHDRADRRLIALAGAPDQFGLSAPEGSYWWCLCGAHDDFARSDDTLLLMSWMRQMQTGSRAWENTTNGWFEPLGGRF